MGYLALSLFLIFTFVLWEKLIYNVHELVGLLPVEYEYSGSGMA